ncbi:MAG: hypothetical protein Q4A78_07315 [Peptostreptococcaceae bacterium]|nr:hypothetical protein [Peptostreptococcaceae bacterium]
MLDKETAYTLITRAKEIEEQMKQLKKENDRIKAQFEAEGQEILSNKNISYFSFETPAGSCHVSLKNKLSVDSAKALEETLGSIVAEKMTVTMEPKYDFKDSKFKSALIALYKEDFEKGSIEEILTQLGITGKEQQAVLKKLKGDYWKDKALLEQYQAQDDDLEEELDAIRRYLNYALIARYVDVDTVPIEQLKKAIFVEETAGIGFDFSE